MLNTNGCVGVECDEPLCFMGGPALFIHDKCVLYAWAALNRLNMGWKCLLAPTVVHCQWKAGWSPDTLAQAHHELFWCWEPFLLGLCCSFHCCPWIRSACINSFVSFCFQYSESYTFQLRRIYWGRGMGCTAFHEDGRRTSWAVLPPSSLLICSHIVSHADIHTFSDICDYSDYQAVKWSHIFVFK